MFACNNVSYFNHSLTPAFRCLGNERVKETKTSGDVLTESQNINKSLLTLGKLTLLTG